MRLNAVAFSAQGKKLISQLKENIEKLGDSISSIDEFVIKSDELSLDEWTQSSFERREPMLFVGATGIAVRAISTYMESKLNDPAVIVMDELGQFVIPVLSGHVGGANDLACDIASVVGGVPVITTATDVNETWAIDNWAIKNNLSIQKKDTIKRVSSAVLEGKPVTISVKPYSEDKSIFDAVDVIIGDSFSTEELEGDALLLKRPQFIVGIGCKRGKEFSDIEEHFCSCLKKCEIEPSDVYCLATIDAKENEPGLKSLSTKYRLPLITFTADMLRSVPGEFSESEFVQSTVGVGNVCERAASLAAGRNGKLVMKKHPKDGVTIAIARR